MSRFDEKDFKSRLHSLLIKDSLSKLGLNANVKVRIDNSNKKNYKVDPKSISLKFFVRNMHIEDTYDGIESYFKKELDIEFGLLDDELSLARDILYKRWWEEIDPMVDELDEMDLDEEEYLMKKDELVLNYYNKHNYNLIMSTFDEVETAIRVLRTGMVSDGKAFHVDWLLEFKHDPLIKGDGMHKAIISGFFNRTKCYINKILPYHLNGVAIYTLDDEDYDSEKPRSYALIDIDQLIEIVEQCYEDMVPKLGLYDEFFDDYEFSYSDGNELIIAQAEEIDWECSFDDITMKSTNSRLIRKKINGVSYLDERKDEDEEDEDDDWDDYEDFL